MPSGRIDCIQQIPARVNSGVTWCIGVSMATKQVKKERGIYEKVPASGIWWISEQLRAQVGDYSRTTEMLMVRQKKERKAPAMRYVPMTPIAIDAYNTLTARKKAGESLCTNRQGGVLYEARYWFLSALEDAGITDFVWYGLRHTAASRWVMNGVPIPVVSKYLGHSNVNQTMVYSHLQPDNAAQAIAAMMSYYLTLN